ncbi:MAG: AAA family ATPase, partial [Gemmatimonadetes bacterium]|nr:AAA family ATPase [Gemmatimonadota bacterium]
MPPDKGAPHGAPPAGLVPGAPAPSGAAVRLRALGRLELVTAGLDGDEVRVLGPSKPLALLAYLALAPRGRATRDRLLTLLWSDADPERGRRTLRQTLWALRQRLGEGALLTEGDEVVLVHPLPVDADHFARAVEAGALAEAWALYRGPFIPEFALLGGAGFERWADARREQLDAAWRAVGMALARQALDAARPLEAIPVLQALADADPADPDAAALLLDALLAAGDRPRAVREADRLEQRLARAGVRPGAAFRATVQRVRRAAALPTATTLAAGEGPRRPEMVGREATFATLLSGWRRATGGAGTIQVMRAAAGLGKTRMLAEVTQRLEDMGGAVVALRARRADRDIPYALAASLATALAGRAGAAGVSTATASVLVALAPGLSNAFPRAVPAPPLEGEALRMRTLALEELLRAVSDEAPLALLVDDLHWGDEASRLLLASVCDRVADLSLLLVLAMRPLRGDWPMPASATAIELLPLSPDQLELLLGSMAHAAPGLLAALSRALHAASGGIPLLAVAALDLAQKRGWLRIDGEVWHAEAPERLGAALAGGSVLDQLMHDLPADALAMLVALALVRGPLSAAALRHVAGSAEAGGVLEALEQRGLVVPAGMEWEVAHDRLADAALEVATVARRHAVTDRLVHTLLADPSPAPRTWQLAGRLLMPVRVEDAARCFRRWMERSPGAAGWRDPLAAAARFLGPDARVPDVQRLARALPLRVRLWRGYPVAFLALG